VIDIYWFDVLDELTIQQLNGHAQMVCPGPYKFYIANEELQIAFHFDDIKEHTWWILKYS